MQLLNQFVLMEGRESCVALADQFFQIVLRRWLAFNPVPAADDADRSPCQCIGHNKAFAVRPPELVANQDRRGWLELLRQLAHSVGKRNEVSLDNVAHLDVGRRLVGRLCIPRDSWAKPGFIV